MSSAFAWLYVPALGLVVASSGRWLRVAQREHYIAGSVARFAWRWWTATRLNWLAGLAAVAGVVAAGFVDWLALGAVALVLVGPLGLAHRGRTAALVWTRRLTSTAFVAAGLAAAALVVFAGAAAGASQGASASVRAMSLAAVAVAVPYFVDLALWGTQPLEKMMSRRWVRRARKRLEKVNPTRLAITGSYGKTTVKGYVRHLTEGSLDVVASPGSYNNTAGLTRTVNEHLRISTKLFVAEMGTYGRGEIAAMVRWVQPSISILISVGPVHLERFGRIENVVSAKTEIFGTASTAIINVDLDLLADEAVRLEASGLRVVRCSAGEFEGGAGGRGADVVVRRADVIELFGREIAVRLPGSALATNVACAVAAASVLGVSDADIAARVPSLPVPDHRRQVSTSPSGVVVIDDTYNSNPAGAAVALEMLAGLEAGRKVVVTPGMVELGGRQFDENSAFAEAATAALADDLLIVGRTNRAALVHGAHNGTAFVRLVADRDEAVAWVRANLVPGDAVLYENDLPDHYP